MKSCSLLLAAALFIFSCKNKDENKTTTTDTTQTSSGSSKHLADTNEVSGPVPIVNHAQVSISGTYPDTAVNGMAHFYLDSATGKVKMNLELHIPSKAGKSVAVHFHEHGDCGNKGDLAHGHWNPGNSQHGKWGTGSFHAGDIGNVKLDKSGKGTLNLATELWSLGGQPDKNIIGKSLIVHGGMDDYTTQPSGNSGARIGCGVIH